MNDTNQTKKIKDLQLCERPREKAITHGVKSLTDVELLAILFSTGIQGKSVLQLSQEILDDYQGHISRVSRLTLNDFTSRYKGIGKAKAITILSALELGQRAAADQALIESDTISSPDHAARIMRRYLGNLQHEEFWILLLDQANKPIRPICVGKGGVAATAVDPRIIFKEAIDHYASGIILFHNHPSGNLKPSMQDDSLTRKICQGGQLLDIRIHDHLILTDSSYYSYQAQGRL